MVPELPVPAIIGSGAAALVRGGEMGYQQRGSAGIDQDTSRSIGF
jgi:hypothetical protein